MACIICQQHDNEKRKFRHKTVDFYECKTCGLIRTWPFPSGTDIENHYNDKFRDGNYSTLLINMPDYIDIYRFYVNLIKQKNHSLKGKLVLDVGCFTGEFLDLAQQEGAITYGIELQKHAYEISQRKHPGRILNCPLEKASFHIKFDIITLFGVVEHVTNPDVLIHKVSACLAPAGIVIIQTPNTGSLIAKLMGRYWPPYLPIEHIHYFSATNMRQLLENSNFTIIEAKPHVKWLTLNYIYAMLHTFGPALHSLLQPLMRILPNWLRKRRIPSYVGEMIIIAQKQA